ncbi:MAG: class 1 fructose-bisphosphatase [candidate division KSB1 bacterium]|nr:class 1 fructose-bisphosphatase [candidate division KSB1 bacterium]MDZ7274387.1 class 1 fructose-bisphosphatase [candidate division KSB1 bacterium]MDZ7284951.1 class 1 fructose-bisphosphatase [candidate division KSB1 bacterium]MDZ7297628.1 class 1 fructose-bisphosphatase [candidate division KSB1 bacterium]MDZ7306368.1 class 1 fructose-bisphosphatase [candidate division KSB1 bacterium]
MVKKLMTIERHIIEQQKSFPQATGEFSALLYDLAFAAKIISREVRRAGLIDILGYTGATNVQGELVRKLDEFADDVIFRALDHTGRLCCMASEERDELIPIPAEFKCGHYVLLYDPLDGSSNIDANVSIGTIFSILRKISPGERGTLADALQPGIKQVGAGYILYGSSTLLVYTAGQGVHGFTLDPTVGEFLLSHENIKTPRRGQIYSTNEGNSGRWSEGMRNYIQYLKQSDKATGRPYSSRYIGSLVSDFHRNLLYGGIFLYPADSKNPNGKLRLLYEANPLALLATQAGGAASNGQQSILTITPTELHQRTPLIIGAAEDVQEAEEFLQGKRTV